MWSRTTTSGSRSTSRTTMPIWMRRLPTTSRLRSRGSGKCSSRRGSRRRRSSGTWRCSPHSPSEAPRFAAREQAVCGRRRRRYDRARERRDQLPSGRAMIVRHQDDAWQVVLQTDHADLSGAVAEAWTDRGPRHDSVVVAARRHDDGWAVWERSPLVGADGAPVGFLDVHVPAHLAFYRAGIAAITDEDPY